MDISKQIYGGGFHSLVNDYEGRREPFTNIESVFPNWELDLEEAKKQMVPKPVEVPVHLEKTDIRHKEASLLGKLQGECQLVYLHALVIAIIRKRSFPDEALALFFRMWAEQGSFLAKTLGIRWQISAATTFAEHGLTLPQRSVGMGLSVLFDSIKLHESERRRSGQVSSKPFPFTKTEGPNPFPLGMSPISIKFSDIDRFLLARLWVQAEEDPLIYPLARSMLLELISDENTVFARLKQLKNKHRHSDLDEKS